MADNAQKKLSRTGLTFYIVALSLVAIVLILISYVAQSRQDKQMDQLSAQLNEQTTAAEGAAQKVEALQTKADGQATLLGQIRAALGIGETDDIAKTIEAKKAESEILLAINAVYRELIVNPEGAPQKLSELEQKYTAAKLSGTDSAPYSPQIIKAYAELLEAVQKAQAK